MLRLTSLWILLCLATTAQARLIVYESFDYASTGDFGRQNSLVQMPGTGFGFATNSSWDIGGYGVSASNWQIADGSLTYPGLPVANNSVIAEPANGVRGASRAAAAPFMGATAPTTNYFSFLIRSTASDPSKFGGLYFDTGANNRGSAAASGQHFVKTSS